MLFPTVEFALFFPVVLVLSWVLMPRQPIWKPFIVAVSYLFYAAANPMFCLLLGGITVGNQIAAVQIAKREDERARKRIAATAVALDLLTLGIFKYYGFFAEDVDRMLGGIGLGLPLPLLTIALPIGISFFTFQAITYVVDVRRRDAEVAPLVDVAIYLSFFPHLVAGPIVRASEFLPQLDKPRDPKRVAVGAGLFLIALGLVKKVGIADYLAREVVDPVFAVPDAYSGIDLLFGAYAYTAQIYCDFSGYTDMAIGLALLLGFVFPQNFNSPYRATGFRDFWRRWHMTLSRFLRDYLYIPLGGNRLGRLFTYRNLMITMVLGGLWHGAAWTFVLWGAFHGAGLAAEHLLGGRLRLPVWAKWVGFFHLVVLGWVMFRAQGIDDFGAYVGGIADLGSSSIVTIPAALMIAAVVGAQLLPSGPLERIQHWFETRRPLVLAGGLAAVIVIVASTIPSQGVPPFIYFQF